ncbi:Rad4-domain-containing protein [Pleurotus eryngii]|uniref:Rad4-domain-containing protein n=1 Tax=Pleurotus eryngii TaxID=5323 RepID=A0A9P5ZWH4_PLEER|nr:Rad4-domain-containing protein [Pleurotus eryngii]
MDPINNSTLSSDDSDDELDWEEVEVPRAEHLEITLQPKATSTRASTKRKGLSHTERLTRIHCHKIHTICLIANGWIRNHWINDELLQARLLSLTPLPLQNSFAMIHKSRVPDAARRGYLFEASITRLAEWWSESFFEVTPEGHLRNRTFEDVQLGLEPQGIRSLAEPAAKKPTAPAPAFQEIIQYLHQSPTIDNETLQDILDDDGEFIRTPKSLMKHALMRKGSRDLSAQLFTALCRSLGIPTRLVVSIQSVPWQANINKPKAKPKGKGKGIESQASSVDPGSGSDAKSTQIQGQSLNGALNEQPQAKSNPIIKLRKQKPKGNRLDGPSPAASSSARNLIPSPSVTPPVFWTEVFSRGDGRWLAVDPVRCIVNKRKAFDPSPGASVPPGPSSFGSLGTPASQKVVRPTFSYAVSENRMAYVLAFEEDGYARDVTRRYAREYGAKVSKVQGQGRGKGRLEWWNRVLSIVHRPYRLHRDDIEDEELDANEMKEAMPTTISGFKDHPLYVLTRHLHQNQIIYPEPPDTPELGKFRGEPVYPRSAVVDLKSSESWLRSEGRVVKAGCQPLKMVKARSGTVNKLREIETLKTAGTGNGEVMQGLYARGQTEMYVPPPVIDGIVPKNNFGNIDLYVPSMLPRGGVHVPYKGVAKIARRLGLDYAEAVTRFDFKNRRALPVVEGVVIAVENEDVLLETYWEAEKEAEEKSHKQREERVVKRWKRLIQALQIRQRLQNQYQNTRDEMPADDHHQPEQGEMVIEKDHDTDQAGGFLVGADDVVQPFHLPRNFHPVLPSYPPVLLPAPHEAGDGVNTSENEDIANPEPVIFKTMDIDSDEEPNVDVNTTSNTSQLNLVPKSMKELAAKMDKASVTEDDVSESSLPPETEVTTDQPTPQSTRTHNGKTLKRSATRSSARVSRRKRKQDSDGDDESMAGDFPLPKKRRTKGLDESVPVPSSSRVLRPRLSRREA